MVGGAPPRGQAAQEAEGQVNSAYDRLTNPRGQALRKWMSDLLKDRFPAHETLVERLGNQTLTNQDLQDLGKLAVDLFEVGYLKCMNDYKAKLDELGIKVTIVADRNG